MKGNMSVCHTSRFWINVRCATTGPSPFSMKYETRVYYAHLPYEEKGYTHNKGASPIWCPCPKISRHVLSLGILSSYLKPRSTCPSVTLDTAVPPLPAVLDTGLGVGRHLDPGLSACHPLIPDPEHVAVHLKHVVHCPRPQSTLASTSSTSLLSSTSSSSLSTSPLSSHTMFP
jgi:hypothetical protein